MSNKKGSKNSLRYQFKKQLALSIGLLVIVFSVLLYKLFYAGIGSTMHRTLMSMARHYAQLVVESPDAVLPRGRVYSAYVGNENIPLDIAAKFDVKNITDRKLYVYEDESIVKMGPPQHNVFLLRYPIRGSAKKLYLIYQERPKPPHHKKRPKPPFDRGDEELEGTSSRNLDGNFKMRPPPPSPDGFREGPIFSVSLSIGLVALLALLLFFWVARQLIKKVITPLEELTVMAKSLDENRPELSFDVLKDKTEVGVVANTLHQTMSRIHNFHQREKQFLQNASHELRTPIAVIKSALDIIALRKRNGKVEVDDQITHIQRANRNMAELTEAILMLSRDGKDESVQLVDLNDIVQTTVAAHQYLIEGKAIEIEVISDEPSLYSLPLTLCQITLSNLIRNAFEHTLSGIVRIRVSKNSVIISNSIGAYGNADVNSNSPSCSGFGIGLNIVNKIVEQQNWQFNTATTQDGCNQVTIIFG